MDIHALAEFEHIAPRLRQLTPDHLGLGISRNRPLAEIVEIDVGYSSSTEAKHVARSRRR